MRKVTGAEASSTLFAMYYSQGKMGKTTTAVGAPKDLRPIAYLDADNGASMRMTVLGATPDQRDAMGVKETIDPWFGPWIKEGIDFYYPDPKKYYGDLWDFAAQVLNSGEYKLGVVDALSSLGRGILGEVKRTDYGGAKRLNIDLGETSVTSVQPSQGDYLMAQTRLMEFLDACNESPAHILLISHEKTGEVKDTATIKRVLGGPLSIGTALLEVIPAVVDITIRLETRQMKVPIEVDGKKRFKTVPRSVMRTTPHSIFLAGDRSGMFEDGMEFSPENFWNTVQGMIALKEKKE